MNEWINCYGGVIPATVIEYPESKRGVISAGPVVRMVERVGGSVSPAFYGDRDRVCVVNEFDEREYVGPGGFIAVLVNRETVVFDNDPRVTAPDHNADHAAAIERERIAAWIVTDAAWPEHDMRTDEWLAQSIRNGDHWKGQP